MGLTEKQIIEQCWRALHADALAEVHEADCRRPQPCPTHARTREGANVAKRMARVSVGEYMTRQFGNEPGPV